MSFKAQMKEFLGAGHLPTLLTAFLYFDFCFAIWVLNGAMAPFISQEFHLTPSMKGWLTAVPVFSGSFLRLPLGFLAQYIGRKRAAMVEMGTICVSLILGYLFVNSFAGVLLMGFGLGIAGASFGVALSLGSGWYPPKFKGLAMGIAGAGNSGTVLAMLFAPPLATQFGWRAVYGLAVIPMLIAIAMLAIFAKEPPDREEKHFKDYLKVLVDKDVWVFNVIYAVTFGGFIGLTSFLPTLFRDQYAIPLKNVGVYAAIITVFASILRVVGGWAGDRLGGIRMLNVLFFIILAGVVGASVLPSSHWVMVGLLVLVFSAMGAGNGAVFQLVPLRYRGDTAVAGSLIGEIGGLAGGVMPLVMGYGKEYQGSFTPGFLAGGLLTLLSIAFLATAAKRWTSSWVGAHGRALETHGHERRQEFAADLD